MMRVGPAGTEVLAEFTGADGAALAEMAFSRREGAGR
jgi:hypothetical protein